MHQGIIQRIRPWLGKSLWAIMDQGLFAFSNFILNLCLARWLSPEAYGSFALAYTIFLFAGVIHSSIFTEPMLVFGSGRYRDAQGSYLRALIRIHWSRAWPASALIIVAVSAAYWQNPARFSILLLAATCGVTLYQWLIRRSCYLSNQPHLAASGGIIYLITTVGGIAALRTHGSLDSLSALTVIAAASLLSGALIHYRLLRQKKPQSTPTIPDQEIIRAHWDYGRWAIATGVIGWFSGNIAMVSLPWWHGNDATAAYRAGFNLILPIQQLLAAAGPLLLPFLVRSRDQAHFRRTALTCATAFSVSPLIWTLLLATAGPWICQWLYDGKYTYDRSFLILLGLSATISSFGQVMASALRAIELPKLAFKGYTASALFSLTLGLPLIAFGGVNGAALALTAAMSVSAITLTCITWKRLQPV
jgi:O-antigen/teichoic acid export membrane protein